MPLLVTRRRRYILLAGVVAAGLLVALFITEPNLLSQQHVRPPPLSGSFIVDPYPPNAGQTVSFVASATGGTSPYNYSWNFGDGSTETRSTATHAYSAAGSFTVVLTVTDGGAPKQSATASRSVTVVASPQPPSSPSNITISYSSSYNDTLEPSGFKPANASDTFLVVHLTIENMGYENFSANPFANMYVVTLEDSNNVSATYIFLRYPFPPTNMTNGQTASGDVAFEVPKTSTSFTPKWRLSAGEQFQFVWIPI